MTRRPEHTGHPRAIATPSGRALTTVILGLVAGLAPIGASRAPATEPGTAIAVQPQRGVRAWVQHGERRIRVLGMAFNRTAVPGRFDRQVPPSGQAGYVSLIVSGEGRGWWTLPEVDDEVVLGFLEGDPDRPLVLGLMGARKDKPAEPAPDDSDWQRVRIRYRMVQRKS